MALPGWYVQYGTKNGLSDGRADLGQVEEEEVSKIKAAAKAIDQADPDAFRPSPEEVVFEDNAQKEAPGMEDEGRGQESQKLAAKPLPGEMVKGYSVISPAVSKQEQPMGINKGSRSN